MDRIDISGLAPVGQRDRYFARTVGTSFAAISGADATTIDLYDEIGAWGVTSKDFRSMLKDSPGDIVLRINSAGGSVFDGIAMFNDLVAHPGKVKVEITGLAASIASVIAMAGDEIEIASTAFMMVHNAWTIEIGNRHDMADMSATLAKIDDAIARTYAGRTTSGIRAIRKMMDDETWLDGKAAKEAGFATSVKDTTAGAKAKFDLSVFANTPAPLVLDDDVFVSPETEEDIEKVLMRDAGRSRSQARALIRDIRSGTTTAPKPKHDAGVDLTPLATALSRALSAFSTN